MKTSHKKNRPFDFKLIDLVEPNPVLYQRQSGLTPFESMKAKNILWKKISEQMGDSAQFCIMRWSNLRGQYQKELRHCRELCPREGVIRGSSWPYLNRLSFLENTVQFNKLKRERAGLRKRSERVMKYKTKPREKTSITKDNNAANDSSIGSVVALKSEDTADGLIGELIDNDGFFIIDEPATTDSFLLDAAQLLPSESMPQNITSNQVNIPSNLQQMTALLSGIEGENLQRIERRIMAFLCKCQLRALSNNTVSDLVI